MHITYFSSVRAARVDPLVDPTDQSAVESTS